MDALRVDELVLTDTTGVWAVQSSSQTVYYVDLDVPALLRKVGPASSRGLADDTWVPLISVECGLRHDSGVIRVGDRHKYLYDFDAGADHYGWWIQRQVTAIERVQGEALAALPIRLGKRRHDGQ
ncbi:hypothetical protein [Cellulomonas cellasea]|uniref:Uncharacterized protein n=1 Tax=Cellulomonas cellasea TaxID=43670 RepID=A0A7W4YCW6_9CELL|nr:hypothetical protein [Cellulomonas cellasea]MBB2924097.1 hypothetical protein [Cellulomonas cellasea]